MINGKTTMQILLILLFITVTIATKLSFLSQSLYIIHSVIYHNIVVEFYIPFVILLFSRRLKM